MSLKIRTAEQIAANARAAMKARVRALREDAIRRGVIVSGMRFATDDQGQARLTGAAVAAILDPEYSVQWKTDAGFTLLSGAQVIAVSHLVRTHVQACFEREAALLSEIDDGGDPDVDAGWPGTV